MSQSYQTFYQALDKHNEKLELFTIAITRAHGESHPEAFDVRGLYKSLVTQARVGRAGTSHLDLDDVFTNLRHVTTDYTVPDDVCPTYAEVYHLLKLLDTTYFNERTQGGE